MQIKDYFKNFTSNTTCASANQYFFIKENADELSICRAYFKIFVGGEFDYSFLYTNIIDSTFSNGLTSKANDICDKWYIHYLRFSVTNDCEANAQSENLFKQITFNNKKTKEVKQGECFVTDIIKINAKAGQFLCLEIAFYGSKIPCHIESQIAIYLLKNGTYYKNSNCPLPAMIGCNRPVKQKIAFLGDSITQGIGATFNSYKHYVAQTADILGNKYSYWNLGIGYARLKDASNDGIWLYKAKQVDIVIICLGVNDLIQGCSVLEIESELKKIIYLLKGYGVKVILQTIPPFDFVGKKLLNWLTLNKYIKDKLSKADVKIFDNINFLCDKKELSKSIYGGHPNDEGCTIWANQLASFILNNL